MDGEITQWIPTEEGAGGPFSLSFKQTPEKPQSVIGVRCCGSPPPFLTKTFVMVEDPETSFIISWSSSGTSFIIWDHLEFAKELLPKYFKHSNFSSFIYQLNNYGFKKIGLRKYEYENKWFQAGKAHLLSNMKRRNEAPKLTRRKRGPRKLKPNAESSRMVVELENLRDDIYLIKLESQKLIQKKGDFGNLVASFKEQVKEMDSKAEAMFMLLSRIFNPSFVQQVIENPEQEQELESHESIKKMILIAPKSNGNSSEPTDKVVNLNSNNQDTASEKPTMCSVDDSGSRIPDQDTNSISVASAAKNCDALVIWKKLLEDDSACENEAEEEAAQQHSKIIDMALDDMMVSKIVMEVEDVIAKEPITDMDDEVTFQLWA